MSRRGGSSSSVASGDRATGSNGNSNELARNPFEDVDLSDDDGDGDDDMAPLVGSSPLEIEHGRYQPSIKRHAMQAATSDKYKIGIALLLASILVLPFLFGASSDKSNANDGDNDDSGHKNASPFTKPPVGVETCPDLDGVPDFAELLDYFASTPNATSCTANSFSNNHEGCQCPNPTIPKARENTEKRPKNGDQWTKAFRKSKNSIQSYVKQRGSSSIDVILLGDSITEHWNGTGMSTPKPKYEKNAQVFQDLFTKAGGGEVEGYQMGISGDMCTNVLYRLQHDQLGDMQSKVIWLLIGTNDIKQAECSADSVVAGNIAIIKELQSQRPHATIVINSLLPREPQFMATIATINAQLECYVDTVNDDTKVQYFDATDIFWNATSKSLKHMPDDLHPDGRGSKLWGEQIVKRVVEIVNK